MQESIKVTTHHDLTILTLQHIIITYEFLLNHTSTHINPHDLNCKTFRFSEFSTQQILRGKQTFSEVAKHLT